MQNKSYGIINRNSKHKRFVNLGVCKLIRRIESKIDLREYMSNIPVHEISSGVNY